MRRAAEAGRARGSLLHRRGASRLVPERQQHPPPYPHPAIEGRNPARGFRPATFGLSVASGTSLPSGCSASALAPSSLRAPIEVVTLPSPLKLVSSEPFGL